MKTDRDKAHNGREYSLWDDGSLDTVIRVDCLVCGNHWHERVNYEDSYRDSDGFLHRDDFNDMVDDLGIDDIECPECGG